MSKAAIIRELGGPDVLSVEDVAPAHIDTAGRKTTGAIILAF